jgi:anthranilate synthase component 2
VDKDTLGPDLTVTAWTADQEIMGLQHRTRPLWGVQFHPESVLTTEGKKILQNFLTL